MNKISAFFVKYFSSYQSLFIVFALLALYASAQSYLTTDLSVIKEGVCTRYNNYLIFKHSFFHLWENKNLFMHHPEDYCDLYKYSPTFSMVFGFFAVLPDWLGLFLWDLLNALVLFWAIYQLPIDKKISLSVGFFVALEMTTNLQNEQSNSLLAGLMVLAFVFMERKNLLLATLFIALAAYIKIFGFAACVLLLFYPNKLKATLYMILWMGVLFLAPLIMVSPEQLWWQYANWGELLAMDHKSVYQLSIMHGLEAWLGVELNKLYALAVGIIMLLVATFKVFLKNNTLSYRLMLLALTCIWVIIFNHKAESPTFIIAVTGLGIWYFVQEKTSRNKVLIWFAFVFTCLSPTDLFPPFVRIEVFRPLIVKVMGSSLIFAFLWWDLMFGKMTFKSSLKESA